MEKDEADIELLLATSRGKRQKIIRMADHLMKKDWKIDQKSNSQSPRLKLLGPSSEDFRKYKMGLVEQLHKLKKPNLSIKEDLDTSYTIKLLNHSGFSSITTNSVLKETYNNAFPKHRTKMLEIKPREKLKAFKLPEPILQHKSKLDLNERSMTSSRQTTTKEKTNLSSRFTVKRRLLFPVLNTTKYEK